MVPVFSCFVRSLELKCEACSCNSKPRYLQAQPATRGIPVHLQKTSTAKGLLIAGKLTDSATGIAVDEKQLISAGQERIGQKDEKDRHVSFEVEAASHKKRK